MARLRAEFRTMDYWMFQSCRIRKSANGGSFMDAFRGRFLNHKAVKSYRTKEVDFFDNGKAMISLDGAVWENGSTPMKIGIHQEWVNFIIPG